LTIVCVSGACSRSGKTALAVTLLRELGPGGAAAVKFTTTDDVFERCPRGTTCVVCDIEVPFRLVEEPDVLRQPGTDTFRLTEAGAAPVVWAIARASAVGPAWSAVRQRLAAEPLIVMEGSTIVHTARPDLMLYVVHPFLSPERWKDGAAALIAAADAVIVNRPAAEERPPAAAVLDALRRLRPQDDVVVADATLPLAAWAPALHARLHALAARPAVAAGARG
jgi:hypothetical protein